MNKERTKKLRADFIAKWVNEHPNEEDDVYIKKAWRQYKKQWKKNKTNR